MDFYFGRFSGNSARAAFGLEEAGAPYQPRLLDVKGGENRAPAYLAINPMGKIPSLVEGEMRLWESNAINWYVAERFPRARLLPDTPEGRASVHRWLFFQAAHLTPACVPIFRATNERMKAFWQSPLDLQAADAGRKELARFLPVLEEALRSCDWLEREFSLADIAHAPHLILIAEGGFDFTPHPRVRRWLDRLRQRPAWQKVENMIFAALPSR